MTTNDVILLDNLLAEWKKTAPTSLDDSELFELFAIEQILKDFDLEAEDLGRGRIGGGNDGGIDGFFTFVNGELADEDTDWKAVPRGPVIAVDIIQAKQQQGFKEVAFDKLQATLRDLLDLSKTKEDLEAVYSPTLLNRAFVFRDALSNLAARHPVVTMEILMATKAATANIDPKVTKKAHNLKEVVREFFSDSETIVTFAGARELLDMARRQVKSTNTLRFIENLNAVGNAYILLVNLRDYFSFITDDSGRLRKNIFEWNVRDYQGGVEVNRDIRRTLDEGTAPEFWWLNNGVTVLAAKASITGKEIALDDVQIVNGLQTSVTIHEYLAANEGRNEERSLLCRVIVTADDSIRDRIIKATNFQTNVPAASLKATDEIQRDIEAFFLSNQWFYDRRKNYYKNLGKPADRIIGIPYLAQAVMSMGLSRPDDSRARPTSLLKDEDDYQRLFDEKIDLRVYLWSAQTMKRVDAYVSKHDAPQARTLREFRFHVAMWAVVRALGAWSRHPSQLLPLCGEQLPDNQLRAAAEELTALLDEYLKMSEYPLDRIAKSREFVQLHLNAGSAPTLSGKLLGRL